MGGRGAFLKIRVQASRVVVLRGRILGATVLL
jgi:hypothetical protein